MIPSQRPMMIEAAKAFSSLIGQQNNVTWSNTVLLDDYIASLKKATHRLAWENKDLAKCHLMIKERVREEVIYGAFRLVVSTWAIQGGLC